MNSIAGEAKVGAPMIARPKRRLNPKKKHDYMWGYLMILPTMVGTIIFNFWPLVQSLYLSFTKWGAFGSYSWGGLVNYRRLFSDPNLAMALRNTIVYALMVVPASLALSILVAVLLNQDIRGVGVYRTLYFLPVVTMTVAVGMVWRWLYNADFGLINHILKLVSIEGPRWLTDPSWSLSSIAVVAIWGGIGHNMVILLSGLQSIPSTYYEAAEIDGANAFIKFFRITLPLLTPTIFFLAVTGLIGALQVFELIFMMIGPESPVIRQTQTLVFMFYREAFIFMDKGYAAAIIFILFLLVLVVTIMQFAAQKKWVHYE